MQGPTVRATVACHRLPRPDWSTGTGTGIDEIVVSLSIGKYNKSRLIVFLRVLCAQPSTLLPL